MPYTSSRKALSAEEKNKRKLYLGAMVVTCIAAAMVFGVAHVVKLGANRMADMRAKAGYDLDDEHKHIRAAGEDIALHKAHELKKQASATYELAEVHSLIRVEQWEELEKQIRIPAGSFTVGTNYQRADLYDQPQHKQELDAYFIDKYPVTNVQYAKFVAEKKYRPPLDWENGQIPDAKYTHPVVMVSWYDAKAYCEYKNKRLPTELEWEKAARGNDDRRWPWGNKMDPSRLNTYYTVGSTTAVDRYEQGKSAYGVYDMVGNVSEWTDSEFKPYTGSKAAASIFVPKSLVARSAKDHVIKVGELEDMDGLAYKVRRGGSWKSDPFASSVYHRNYSLPHYASDFFGFRCASDVTTQ